MAMCSSITLAPLPQNPKVNPLLTALASSTTLTHLKQVHAHILRSKLERSNYLLFRLVLSSCAISSASASASGLDYALSVFSQIRNPETHFCNQVLRQFSRGPRPGKTLLLYEKLRRDGSTLDRFSFPPLLKAVSKVSAFNEGLEIHGLVSKLGFHADPFIQTGLIAMYAACRRIMDARLLFDKMSYRDVVTWNIMIDGYCQSGLYDHVLRLYEEMKGSGIEPDAVILCTVLSACGHAGNLSYGKAIHEFIKDNGLDVDSYIQSALVNMYANCGAMDLAREIYDKLPSKPLVVSTAMLSGYAKLGMVKDARLIFDQMIEKDLVCWSAMISGYAESDQPQEALKLFNEMQLQRIVPDQITMLSVISACAHVGALNQAKWIHRYADKNGFGRVLSVNNALIDMYAKCGNLVRAREVFENMPRKNVISWSSMINAFAMHGDADSAINLFHRMREENIEPNGVTFIGVLYACSHAGLVEEGQKFFSSMINEHGISPKREHYGCMVDLYCRANLLRKAMELIETMPFAPNVIIWGSLMSACQVHGEVELGEFAAKRLLELEPDHDGALVVLSNIYAKEKRWNDVGLIRKSMRHKGISKERACSRIEMNNEVHVFLMADRYHEQSDEIYEKLDEVVSQLKLVGYMPSTSGILIDLEEEEKKVVVLWHSEKLALSYGLISARKESCIRIVKNLRICEDCHSFMKLVSKVYQIEVVVRDRTRFHHFNGGICSCRDYW
ncbi:pentatricopeptide repeat-containing protein At4g14820 [Gastrolobium bilobum]|uniref:pentatricopeptide repeat-containing protein At4g14820 n=1 Tax=Gastrolobium bilobum TaxID=150636 RepID=UPI002AAFBB3A|nr:pentatricopeptide repeat-containing protein At4g14820 [Gastrolobium bilobum]